MTKLDFIPFRDYIITEKPEVKEVTDSGIFIPEIAQEKLKPVPELRAIVLAAGPDAPCTAGDIVAMHPEATAVQLMIHGKPYLAFTEYAFIGILGRVDEPELKKSVEG